ncbi:MAG: NUDIX domain-containing protein, partial [Chitinophagaceae bacterium]
SVFIFNKKGEMLLQQRARNKYHSADLWTNACCSHPSPGEATQDAANRRLFQEMGFSTALKEVFAFVYKTPYDNGLTEHEFDHVFTGTYEGVIKPDPEEVKDYCFKSLDEIEATLQSHPAKYTSWFHIAFPKIREATAVVAS